MKFLKNNLKVIIAFIVGVILAGGIVYAATSARDIIYTTAKNAQIKNVEDAINDLYNKKTLSAQQVGTLTAQNVSYTFQNDGYIIGTASSSNGKNAVILLEDGQNYILAPYNVSTVYPVSLYIQKGTKITTRTDGGIYNLTCYEFK